jgi:tetratricopeptide (TPR) repeat protein
VAPPEFSRLLDEGRRALIEGDVAAFRKVLSDLSGHAIEMADASADILRARLLYMAEHYDEALEACRRALSNGSTDTVAHEIRAQIHFFRDELEEARESALKVLESQPLDSLAQAVLDHIERRRERLASRDSGGRRDGG